MKCLLPESGVSGQLSADPAGGPVTGECGAGRASESDLQQRPGSAEEAQPQNEDSQARPQACALEDVM